MQTVERDGTVLAFTDSGAGAKSVVLIHGWGCDHRFLKPQMIRFQQLGWRVLSVDLRGHGASAAPDQDYTMSLLADDVAYLCSQLHITRPALVGHSMGGMIALELAASRPALPSSVVLIDSLVFPRTATLKALQPLRQAIRQADYVNVYKSAVSSLMLSSDRNVLLQKLIDTTPCAPQNVLISALDSHFDQDAMVTAASRINLPIAYVGATNPLGDVEQFRKYTPHLVTAQTLGSGHFSPLQVPAQVNEMLLSFLSMIEDRPTDDACKTRALAIETGG